MASWICLLVFFIPIVTGKYVRPKDFDSKANVQLWYCDREASGQQWVYQSNDNTLRPLNKRLKCLHVVDDIGSAVWLYDCYDDYKDLAYQHQQWSLTNNGTLVNTISRKCLETDSRDLTLKSIIQLGTCSGQDRQIWIYNSQDQTLRPTLDQSMCLDVGSTGSCSKSPWNTYPYCNYKLDVESRVKNLLPRMSLTEKVGLMQNDYGGVPNLAIPVFGHTECTHGTFNNGHLKTTLFPHAITFARSFNRQLVFNIARAISDEVRAKHNTANAMGIYKYPFGVVCWAPVVNVCRDPRWGRCQEGYGEDPFLQGQLATQYIKALQNSPTSSYVQAVATCKHFDVHSGPEDIPVDRMSFNSVVSYRDWIETFQPAFKACNDAGVMSYMCSYNAINGVPSCANYELLTELAREKWGFDGFVVSDCNAVRQVYTDHHFARDDVEAAVFCAKAGCDWNCGSEYSHLYDAVQQDLLSEDALDVSVARLLKAMFRLGLFDPPEIVNFQHLNMSVVDDHVTINRLAAQQSIVLLKNKNNILPLDLTKYENVLVVGPCADDTSCATGDYAPTPKYITTVYESLNKNTNLKVTLATVCNSGVSCSSVDFDYANLAVTFTDLIVYVGGISFAIEEEGTDRSSIELPGYQSYIISKLVSSGKPVIVVLYHGAPVISPVYQDVDALLSVGYGGQEAGDAVLDILTGAHNPSGRLVVTWYAGDNQLPNMTDYSMVNRTYRYMEGKPMFYFGYGLSYTTFTYSDFKISTTYVKSCQNLSGSFIVHNTGSVKGDEVAQVYMSFINASVPTTKIKLVGFEHISDLAPGDNATVEFSISPEQMTVVREEDFAQIIEPGFFDLYVGGHQPDDTDGPSNVLKSTFNVIGDTTLFSEC